MAFSRNNMLPGLVALVAFVPACGYNAALRPALAPICVPPTESGLRTVKTVIVIDPWWHWSNDGPLRVMADITNDWEHDFGIRFEIVEVVRDRIGGLNSIYKLKHLRERYPIGPERELFILFTGSTGMLTLEVTEVLGNHVVIGPSPVEATRPIVHHGLGHVFGAPHSLLPGNYMTAWALPIITTQTSGLIGFPRSANDAISENKWRSFGVETETVRRPTVPPRPEAALVDEQAATYAGSAGQ